MKRINAIKILIFSFIFIISTPVLAVDNLNNAFDFADDAGYYAGYDVHSGATAEGMVGVVINTALSLLGIFFMLLIIYGGFTWMSDRGNEDKAEKGKKIITAAVVGLVIVVAAYAISYFVTNILIDTLQ